MSGKGKKAAAPKKKANGYKMPAPIATGEVIHDTIGKKKWRFGPSIGVGGFGEIYSACDHEATPKNGSSYPFVIKIEPHENGPLFVEKNFYVRNANKDDIQKFMQSHKLSSLGMPTFYGNGSHEYKGEKYRYLVLERYDKDLWTIFKENGRTFPVPTVFQIGLQMLDVLEYIHSRGYVHADLKGANIMLGRGKACDQAYLLDFGLAARVGEKEFKPDPKCAHNGTIEYTSRDAHLGVATMRGDLEILGYNLLQWAGGELPWEKRLGKPKEVQEAKETFLKNVRENITKQYKDIPDALIQFFEYINSLKPKDVPDYDKCRKIFLSYLKSVGKTRSSKLEFTTKKTKVRNDSSSDEAASKSPKKTKKRAVKENGDVKVAKRGRPVKAKVTQNENETPNGSEEKIKPTKRKSDEKKSEIVKKAKLTPKATPPVKKNHANIATQTSADKRRRSPRQVSFDSPICEIIGDKKRDQSANSSGDMFDDSFTMDGKKKPKKRLISDEEVTVKRVVKKKVTSKVKARTWRDVPTVVNGRSVPS